VDALVRIEARLLDLVRRRFADAGVPVSVPDWQVRADLPGALIDIAARNAPAGNGDGPGTAGSALVAGYRRLPGEPAGTEDPRTALLAWRPGFAASPSFVDDLARVLATLHGTPRSGPVAAGVTPAGIGDSRERIAALLAQARSPLRVPERWWSYWQRWLAGPTWPGHTVLVHGDLHPGHLLAGPDHRLTGIIDWTDAGLDDAARDFADPAYHFGPKILDDLLAAYTRHGGRLQPGHREHIEARVSLFPVHFGLYGLAENRDDFVARARARLTTSPPASSSPAPSPRTAAPPSTPAPSGDSATRSPA
jgi:macrolide phosphotransferase